MLPVCDLKFLNSFPVQKPPFSTGKKKKNVMILTTTVPILGRTKDDGKRKPTIYKRYDYEKCGVDVMDQHFAQKTVRMKSNRWTTNPCKYFF